MLFIVTDQWMHGEEGDVENGPAGRTELVVEETRQLFAFGLGWPAWPQLGALSMLPGGGRESSHLITGSPSIVSQFLASVCVCTAPNRGLWSRGQLPSMLCLRV